MKFKIVKGTELFKKLKEIHKEMIAANDAAEELMKSVQIEGVTFEGVARYDYGIAGGIRGFCATKYFTRDTVPAGWKLLEKGSSKWIFPKSSDKGNKKLLEKISKLPIVKKDGIKKLFKYDNYGYVEGGGIGMSTIPGVEWHDKYILVETPNSVSYKPVPDMIEILESEYKKLSKK